MNLFEIALYAHRVVFGKSLSDALRDEAAGGNLGAYALVTTPGMAVRFDALITEAVRASRVGVFSQAVPHVPEENAARAVECVATSGASSIVAFGGGSAIDTAKAVAHRLHLPIIAAPTNFSGSEATWNFGLTRDGRKRTVRAPKVLPQTVVYDPRLLATLPHKEAICSGMNAIAHAIEGLYAPASNPLTRSIALGGIGSLIAGLRNRRAGSGEANAQCFAGSWLCAEVLSQVGMGLHHRICHVLGGAYGLPHAATHAVILPYSVEFNRGFAPALEELTPHFGDRSPAMGIAHFARGLGAPRNLAELGFRREMIDGAIGSILTDPVTNPRAVTATAVAEILAKALLGQDPQ